MVLIEIGIVIFALFFVPAIEGSIFEFRGFVLSWLARSKVTESFFPTSTLPEAPSTLMFPLKTASDGIDVVHLHAKVGSIFQRNRLAAKIYSELIVFSARKSIYAVPCCTLML